MKQQATTRRSHCITCGKRLSDKTSSGAIRWRPSSVDDKGIHCETCGAVLNPVKNKKEKKS